MICSDEQKLEHSLLYPRDKMQLRTLDAKEEEGRGGVDGGGRGEEKKIYITKQFT